VVVGIGFAGILGNLRVAVIAQGGGAVLTAKAAWDAGGFHETAVCGQPKSSGPLSFFFWLCRTGLPFAFLVAF
jgi:hypothetical protein